MSKLKWYVAVLSTTILLAVSVFCFNLYNTGVEAPLKALNVNFGFDILGYNMLRKITIILYDPSSENMTVQEVRINDTILFSWTMKPETLKPGRVGLLQIYYPWRSARKYLFRIFTNKGEKTVINSSPPLNTIGIRIVNNLGEKFEDLISFTFFFADGEHKKEDIGVLRDDEKTVPYVIWGTVYYKSGYIHSTVITFPVNLSPGSSATYWIVNNGSNIKFNESSLKLIQTSNKVEVLNPVYRVRFNFTDRLLGSLDYSGPVRGETSFARAFKPGYYGWFYSIRLVWNKSVLNYLQDLRRVTEGLSFEVEIKDEG
ncbi:MAG: hypothetical protein J7L38_04600 [Thermoproteales archaeon]|nr:hypothetical protein [Thermoproteales archaeon]